MNVHAVELILKRSVEIAANPIPEPEVKKKPHEREVFKKYKKLVWKITDKQKLHTLPHFNERGWRTGYHLDHKISIWFGFKNNIAPEVIGDIKNLEFIPWKQNLNKNTKPNLAGITGVQTSLFVK